MVYANAKKNEKNAYFIPTKSNCMIYIWSCVNSNAIFYLMPQLWLELANQITTVKKMFEVFKTSFDNLNQAQNMHIQYQNLKQNNNMFITF